MILLEAVYGNDLMLAIIIGVLLLASPALIAFLIAIFVRKKHPNLAKYLVMGGVFYLVIGAGICGNMMM